MTVYVDDWQTDRQIGRIRHWAGHMTADTREELLEMAARIGLSASWVQHDNDEDTRHFDLTGSKREAAIRAGAVPVTWREAALARMARRAARR